MESKNRKKIKKYGLPVGLIVGSFAVGSAFGPGFASAQDGEDGESTVEDSSEEKDSSTKERKSSKKKGQRLEILNELGITAEELKAGFADGKTLAEVAEEQGVERDALVSALTDAAQERLAEREANLAERIESKIDRAPGEKGKKNRGHGKRGMKVATEDVEA